MDAPLGVVYGRHVVSELLARRPADIEALYVQHEAKGALSAKRPLAALIEAAKAAQIGVGSLGRPELDRLSEGGVHQGVVARVRPFAYATLQAILDGPAPTLLVVLDQVQDPRNLGAIVRSSAALGASGVILPADRSAKMSASAIKASAGAAFIVPIAEVKNLRRALGQLTEAGIWKHGLAADAVSTLMAVDWRLPSAIVVGSEGEGLRRLTREGCDTLVSIPAGGMESLNVSVAASLALYEAARQRGQG